MTHALSWAANDWCRDHEFVSRSRSELASNFLWTAVNSSFGVILIVRSFRPWRILTEHQPTHPPHTHTHENAASKEITVNRTVKYFMVLNIYANYSGWHMCTRDGISVGASKAICSVIFCLLRSLTSKLAAASFCTEQEIYTMGFTTKIPWRLVTRILFDHFNIRVTLEPTVISTESLLAPHGTAGFRWAQF
jgi:hypothetical protein